MITRPAPGRGGPQHIPTPPGATIGDPPPWAGAPVERRRPSVADIESALANGRPPKTSPLERVASPGSAVLAPIYERDEEPWIILTRRSWEMRSHRGEVSLPGGRRDPEDLSLWDTALREAHEEIALDPETVRWVGELDHLTTVISRNVIVPLVGVVDPAPDPSALRPEPGEVDTIIHVPVAELLLDEVYRQERWGIAGVDRAMHFFDLTTDTVWGATASMLVDLLCRVTVDR